MDRDIEQAADAGGPTRPWGAMKEWTQAQRDKAAGTDPVPAEAVEAAVETYGRMALQDGIDWTDCLKAALAAAAPLIAADRDNRIARRALKDLDTALAEVNRLTAERDAAAESIQARDRIIAALQAKILGDFPGGPR